MTRIKPGEIPFKISDSGFYLDGRLTAIVDGSAYDFMGRKIFTTGFFRKNVGFGIVNIDIELNTNMNPIVTITLKDLYGNTMFGKKNIDDKIPNYKVLFNWPPPKFLFTFKGYLGNQVTWLLTLKQTSVTYQSDGSYDIKCDFIPNQWGFMSDLPFLFLLACKGLRKKELSDSDFREKVTGIFDLIKIGRRIEVKTQDVSSEFDGILQQLNLIKSNRIVEAIAYSRLIKFDQAIDGTVGNTKIKGSGSLGFKSITINTPNNPSIRTIEGLKSYTSTNAESLRKVNLFLLLNADMEGIPPLGVSLEQINFDSGPFRPDEVKRRTDLIDNNIKIIQNAIKDKVYKSSKDQLRQITIGEMFKQLAKDSAYLMGRILKAGEEGYLKNAERRNSAVENQTIINRHFPLMVDPVTKEEMPAKGFGVDENEMAFVELFITAITEGIAKDLIQVNQQEQGISQENSLVRRINNVEGPKGNPYKPFYKNIAQNVMVRAGIIAFLTRSNDPNYPGDYDAYGVDRESVEEVLKLASSDMQNITVEMLSELDETEAIQLKQFCNYWVNLISEDGKNLLKTDGTLGIDTSLDGYGFDVSIPNELRNRAVIVDKASGQRKNLTEIINSVFGSPKNNANSNLGTIDTANGGFINRDTLQAQAIYNNGILYRVPITNLLNDDYTFVLFEGQDSTKVRSVNNAESDGEARSADPDAASFFELSKDNLLGYVPIDTYTGTDGNILPRIEFINDRFSIAILKYSEMANPLREAWNNPAVWFATCVYPNDSQIVDPNTNIAIDEKKIPASNITVSIAFHPYTEDLGLVFAPFYNTTSGRNHRACIKKMCSIILDKFSTLEEQKNKIVSDILGQAEEGKNALYKQFNILYHQWETLIFLDANKGGTDGTYTRLSPSEIVPELEERFGGSSQHKTPKSGNKKLDVDTYKNGTFVYDYPLNNTAKIDVRNSLINIDPMYNPNGSTTVLNIIQQVCQKNNFMFIPIPGNGDFNNCVDIFTPKTSVDVELKNLFYIMFAPTPESRTKLDNSDSATLSQKIDVDIIDDVIEVQVGSVDNKIFKSIDIETYENKPTAESIVNLQRLTDNENQNKKITTDCSLLPVMEGRSCKTTFEMIGNAQIFPMQYFYLDSIPLFNGLYQTLKVNHSITPNDMTTKAQGVRMRFAPGSSGGIQPITLETFENLNVSFDEVDNSNLTRREAATNRPTPSDFGEITQGAGVPVGSGGSGPSTKNRPASCPALPPLSRKTISVSEMITLVNKVFFDLPATARAGIVGVLKVESGFNSVAYNSTGGGCGAFGLAQWRSNRQKGLFKYAESKGKPVYDHATQLEFLKQELKSSYPNLWSLMTNKTLSVIQHTAVFHISQGLGNSNPFSYYKLIVDLASYIREYEKRGGRTASVIPERVNVANSAYKNMS